MHNVRREDVIAYRQGHLRMLAGDREELLELARLRRVHRQTRLPHRALQRLHHSTARAEPCELLWWHGNGFADRPCTSKSRPACAFVTTPWPSSCRSRGEAFLKRRGLLMCVMILCSAAATWSAGKTCWGLSVMLRLPACAQRPLQWAPTFAGACWGALSRCCCLSRAICIVQQEEGKLTSTEKWICRALAGCYDLPLLFGSLHSLLL